MTTVAELSLRPDLVAAEQQLHESLGRPGAWWTAAERVAIAAEVRRALDADLAPWEAPSNVDGLIVADHPLPPAAVDAVWRISNHPGTLTQSWFDEIVVGLPSVLHYVELVALVAMVNATERLSRALGADPTPLPTPLEGEPSQETAAGVTTDTHWVPTNPIDGPNVLGALSAVPADSRLQRTVAEAMYIPTDAVVGDLTWSRGTIDRRQIELLAARTSFNNECFY